MSLTVKLDRERKESLERFVAELVLKEGLKITHQEALGLMVDYSLENKEQLVRRLKKLPELEDDPAWRMLKAPDDWGAEDASETVDEYVYGSR